MRVTIFLKIKLNFLNESSWQLRWNDLILSEKPVDELRRTVFHSSGAQMNENNFSFWISKIGNDQSHLSVLNQVFTLKKKLKKEASVFSFSASWHWACCFCCCCCFLVLWSLLPARCIYEKLFLTVCYFGQLFWPFADHCNWLRIGNAIHQTQSFIFHFSQLALASSAAHCTNMPIRLNLVCFKFNCIGIERVHSSAWWKLKQTD